MSPPSGPKGRVPTAFPESRAAPAPAHSPLATSGLRHLQTSALTPLLAAVLCLHISTFLLGQQLVHRTGHKVLPETADSWASAQAYGPASLGMGPGPLQNAASDADTHSVCRPLDCPGAAFWFKALWRMALAAVTLEDGYCRARIGQNRSARAPGLFFL